jgi:hypothetical protein
VEKSSDRGRCMAGVVTERPADGFADEEIFFIRELE